ncbi:MAG: acyl-CoA/acyl-ACP dehydrogenase [Chloroflexi bacterium]|nr:acyl-CoA/acyl-ACP dehydrogenase [Chloroflexota bacterium]
MDVTLTKDQKDILEKAEWLAEECLGPRAAEYDREAKHPIESWKDVWKQGLLGLAVPKEYGGLGLDMPTYVMTVERLAYGCTSTGMTVHMHSVVQRYIDGLATREQKQVFYSDVIEKGRMFGSWGSEPERRGGTGVGDTVLAPKNGGYELNGRKHFCTMAGATHRSLVHCTMEGYDKVSGYILALVPETTPGVNIVGEWDTIGMRATVSPAVHFEKCMLTEEDVLGEPGRGDKLGIGQGFGLGYSAVFIGAAQKALDFVKEYANTHQFDPEPVPLSHSLVVQRHVAEMTMALEGARLVLYNGASQWEKSNPYERAVLGARAKYLATEASLMVTSKAIQTVGGRSAHRSLPLDRIFRDIRTCTLMPPNPDRAMEIIGRAELNVGSEGDDMLTRLSPYVS